MAGVRQLKGEKILCPSEAAAREQIVRVVHVFVGFALERNVGVGPSAHRQADEPLYQIPQIEAHDEHLQHLSRVDSLVLNEVCRDAHPFSAEQQAADVDGVVATEG